MLSQAEATEPDSEEAAPQARQSLFVAFLQQEPPKLEQPAPVPAPEAPAPPAPVSKPQSNPYLNFRSQDADPAQPKVPESALKTELQKHATDQAGPVGPVPKQKPFSFGRSDSKLEADEPAKAAEEPQASMPPPVTAPEQPKNRFSFSAPKPEVPRPEAPKLALPKPGEQQCTVRLAVARQSNSSVKARGAKLGARRAAPHSVSAKCVPELVGLRWLHADGRLSRCSLLSGRDLVAAIATNAVHSKCSLSHCSSGTGGVQPS